MKSLRIFTCVIVLCGIATLTSCEKDDISGIRPGPPIPDKGTLEMRVVDGSRQEVPGIVINLSKSEIDLHHSTYVATEVTDIKGRADFGSLKYGEYFYHAEGKIDGARCVREGTVIVQTERDLIREIVLK